jgi:tryptophan synthase alpha chain
VSSIKEKFAELKKKNEAALVLFVTAGDQPLSDLPRLLGFLESAGADLIEIGIPFSDPFGEGPTIQQSSQRSLERGTTPSNILEAMKAARVSVPLITMGYYNPVLRAGLDEFARESRDAGSSGAIVNDLVPDESADWRGACERAGLKTVFLVAPTSSEARIREVALHSTGFIYIVSRTGVTGAENQIPEDVGELVQKVKKLTDQPACVGFGISTPAHVKRVSGFCDGAVVGSALVALLHEKWPHDKEAIRSFVAGLKAATRRNSD